MLQRIIIVDDEISARMSVELALTMAGYAVFGTDNGKDAVKAIAESNATTSQFDLLITDLHMPGMSGIELMDRLHELRIEIPKLAFTGYADDRVIRELELRGCHDLYEKPLDPKSITHCVGNVLQQHMNRESGWEKGILPPDPFRLARMETAFNTLMAKFD